MKLLLSRNSVIKKEHITRTLIVIFILTNFTSFTLLFPQRTDSGALTTASATLGNSRMSYRADISGAHSSGSSVITIASGSGDPDTDHLFPGDTICFTNAAESGCHGHTTYLVNTVTSGTVFNISPPLSTALLDSDLVIASQSGSLALSFVNPAAIPSDGDILITIPSVDTTGKTADGIPDTGATASVNGFDLTKTAAGASPGIVAADIATTGCTDGNWNATETITAGTASTDHLIQVDRQTTSCAAATTITVTIDAAPGIINPAPYINTNTQGQADIYTINVKTRDGSNNTLDEVDIDIAPIEAVFVSATIDETLTFTVAGVASTTNTCGATSLTTVTTTAMSIPFGTLSTPTSATASQQLTVATNADGGYVVSLQENDQLSVNGAASTTLADATCDDGTCTHTSSAEWKTGYNPAKGALGYSLANVTGTDAAFLYNDSSRIFSARNIAENGVDFTPPTTTAPTIMSNAGPVNANSIYVCYMIAAQVTQEAGYYYNKLRYTATATF